MTVSSSISKQTHLTNEAVGIYSFPFKVFKASEVSVSVVDPDTSETSALLLTSDYTVLGLNEDSGGQILLTQAGIIKAGIGKHLVIMRSMPFTQEVDYRPHDIFPAETHERALDIAAMERQELREKIGRAVLAPPDMDSSVGYSDFQTLHAETVSAAGSAASDRLKAEDAAARAEAAAGAGEGEAVFPASLEELQAGEVKNKYVSPWAMANRNPKFLYEDAIGATLETPAASQEKADAALRAAKEYFDESGVPDASTTVKGKVMLAATNDITSTTKAATPAGVAAHIAAAATGMTNSVIITASGTWTPPRVGIYTIKLIGGGGGSATKGGTAAYPAGGGSGGCRTFTVEISSLDPIPVKIGAGGGGGALLNTDGGGYGGGATLITINNLLHGVGGGGGGGYSTNSSYPGGGGGAGGPFLLSDASGGRGESYPGTTGGAGSGYYAGAGGSSGGNGSPSFNNTGGGGGSSPTGGTIYEAPGNYGRGASAPSTTYTAGNAGTQGCIQIFW